LVVSIYAIPRPSKPRLPYHPESHRHLYPHNLLGPLQRERLSSEVVIHLLDLVYLRNRQRFEVGRTVECRREDFGFYTQVAVRRARKSLESAPKAMEVQILPFFCRNLLSLQIQVQVDVRWMRLHGLQSSVLLILGSMVLSANGEQGPDKHLAPTYRGSRRQHEEYCSWDLA
jgi:hypothetical protein